VAARQYDHGVTPAVALQFWLVEVHKSQNNDTLWYRVGTDLQGDQINWGPARQYDHGVTPAVVIAGQLVIEVHQSENNDTLWPDRAGLAKTKRSYQAQAEFCDLGPFR
jgi:hypothetical protein